jgi:capsular exopolysaccharide synthesis family protein
MKFPDWKSISPWRKGGDVARPGFREGVILARERGKEDPLFRESLLALRARFEHGAAAMGIRIVAVTSSVAGEGKTAVTSSLANLLAVGGEKPVLLVDADMRKCDASTEMGVSASPGLSDYLSGRATEEEIVRRTAEPRLFFVPGGKRVENGSELLASEKFRNFLSAVRVRYGTVIFDTPPVLPVADTLALRGQVDAFIFLYRAGSTPYPLLKEAMAEVGETSILGVVLNGVESRSERYYTRYYGKYYHGRSAAASGGNGKGAAAGEGGKA